MDSITLSPAADLTYTVAGQATISAVSGSGSVVTYTTSAAHGFIADNTVTVAGITTTTAYNGAKIIASVPTATTFTVQAPTTGTGTISGDETATFNTTGSAVVNTSTAHGLVVGQRVRLTDATYGNASIAVTSIPSTTTFMIATTYTAAVTGASNMYRYFHETSGSQATLNFLNRGVLPNVSVDNITVTLSAETL